MYTYYIRPFVKKIIYAVSMTDVVRSYYIYL